MKAALLILGGVSGATFLLTLSTLSYWLSECGLSKTIVGLFAAATLPYSLKFLLPPLLEKYGFSILHMGRTKSWMLLSQLGLGFGLFFLGYSNPAQTPWLTALYALFISLCATTHDCLIDGARLSLAREQDQTWAASLETIGFRLGMICGGAGALYLAHFTNWPITYSIFGTTLWVIGSLTVLIGIPSKHTHSIYQDLPIKKIYRNLWREVLINPNMLPILGWIIFFKWGDTVVNSMVTPFLWEMGYNKLEVANVTKSFGLSLTVIGSLLSPVCIRFFGLSQTGVLCAMGQAISCLLFTIQSWVGYHMSILFIIVGIESLVSGLASATFLIILSQACRLSSSPMSQFVILCSFGSLVRVLGSSLAGWMADHMGWSYLFSISSLVFFPTLLLAKRHVTIIQKLEETQSDDQEIFGKKSEAGFGSKKQYCKA